MINDFQAYVLCTSPRSGSTLLCQLLAATGNSGNPDSHFHSPSIADWAGYYKLSQYENQSERSHLSEIFQAAIIRGTGKTGMFGLRLQGHSLAYFLKKLAVLVPESKSDRERIEYVFGRTLFVKLSRLNKVEQAISYVKASQTGVWHQDKVALELERHTKRRPPTYDSQAIQQKIEEFVMMDKSWNSWFIKQEIEPLRVNYEDLSADPIGVTGMVLEQLGLTRELLVGVEPSLTKLADTTNIKWASRFLNIDKV